jgi:hypothetical protein
MTLTVSGAEIVEHKDDIDENVEVVEGNPGITVPNGSLRSESNKFSCMLM